MFNFVKLSSVLLLGTLIGCSPNIEKIAETPPASGTFEQALFDNYLELATMERDEYDRRDANKFADRASMLAAGSSVGPEAIASRNLPADRVSTLTGARKRLTTAFYNGSKLVVPVDSAKAQSSFDCWMQEQEENRQPDHIAACQADFIAAMERIDLALADDEEEEMVEAPAVVAAAAPVMMAMPDPVSIFFVFDQSKADELALYQIDQVIATFKESGASVLYLSGYTDSAGASDYNDALAQKRVEAVRDALESKGIAGSAISTEFFGQKMQAVVTKDNVREARNRRVEVKFVK